MRITGTDDYLLTNEAVSILENAGLMGVKIPEVLRSRIDVLRKEEQSK